MTKVISGNLYLCFMILGKIKILIGYESWEWPARRWPDNKHKRDACASDWSLPTIKNYAIAGSLRPSSPVSTRPAKRFSNFAFPFIINDVSYHRELLLRSTTNCSLDPLAM